MTNLLKIEFYKLKRSKMVYFFIFLCIMQSIVVYAVTTYGFSTNLATSSGKETLLFMFGIQDGLALNIIAGVLAADYICIEFTSGHIKNLVAYGHKRINIFIAKSIVYYVTVIIITFIGPLIMAIINTVLNGYGEAFTFHSLIFLIKIFFFMVITHIGIGSISVLAAFVFRNSNIVICIVIGIDFINRILNILNIQKPSPIIKWVFDKIILTQSNIVLMDNAGLAEFLQAFIICLITILVTTSLGIYMFKKSDIK